MTHRSHGSWVTAVDPFAALTMTTLVPYLSAYLGLFAGIPLDCYLIHRILPIYPMQLLCILTSLENYEGIMFDSPEHAVRTNLLDSIEDVPIFFSGNLF